jgi:hypothetical protein
VSFTQEFVGLIQRHRICGSDPVDIDRVVDHTAVNTVAPHHAARQYRPRARTLPSPATSPRGRVVCFESVLGWPSTHGLSSARAHVDVKCCQDRAWL